MAYELKLDQFSGPLDKLLELIEARRMEITEISLADVTDDFMRYLRSLSDSGVDMRLMADFISVASRLILIKSKVLLPELALTAEEETGIRELESRLRVYQQLKPAMHLIAKLWRAPNKEFSRQYLLIKGSSVFYPGNNLTAPAVLEAMRKLFKVFESLELEEKTIKETIVTVEEKIEEIVKRIRKEGETKFKSLAWRKSRSEIIAIFLAILHLAHEQLVFLEQSQHFSDIIIKKSRPMGTKKVKSRG